MQGLCSDYRIGPKSTPVLPFSPCSVPFQSLTRLTYPGSWDLYVGTLLQGRCLPDLLRSIDWVAADWTTTGQRLSLPSHREFGPTVLTRRPFRAARGSIPFGTNIYHAILEFNVPQSMIVMTSYTL